MARADPTGPQPAARVPLLAHLSLIWRLRLTVAGNRLSRASGAPAALGTLAIGAATLGLGYGAYRLLSHPALGDSEIWSVFLVLFIAFVSTSVFIAWPVLSAGVDEHSELSRFATFPITPFRLFIASSVSGLVEPRSLAFYPPIVGAVLGFRVHYPFPLLPGAALLFAYLLFNLAWGRAGLTLVLNVLRHRRSAEILGVVFLGGLFLASLAPPLPFDIAWLYGVIRGETAVGGDLDAEFVYSASHALAQLPTASFPLGLFALNRGDGVVAVGHLLELCFGAAVGLGLSYWLLVRFYRGTARPQKPAKERAARPGRLRDGALWALVDREASDFVRNPKARLLASVPFFLCILLKLAGAREMADALAGGAADAWLLAILASYSGLVVGANFAQNVFAYDGPGLALLYAAPVPLRSVFLAKNLVHALGGLVVALALVAFYGLYLHPIDGSSAAFALAALLGQIPVLLATGNFVSVLAPRKFHASLRRRDRSTALATFSGLASAAVAVAPMGLALALLNRAPPGPGAVAGLALWAALAWMAYVLLLPRACRLLEARRETVLRLVMRE